jgi:hypothetical protein
MISVGQNMSCAYKSDIEEILMFKTFKALKGRSNCVLFRSHVTGSNDATLGEVG